MFNKHYIVNVRIDLIEYDHAFSSEVIIQAPSSDLACDYAIYLESTSPSKLNWVENGAVDMNGKIKMSTTCKTVENHHLTALRKNFLIWNYCQKDLDNSGNYLELKNVASQPVS